MLLSVGYERRSPEEFIELLAFWRMEVLVDVRLTPVSRRKGFSKRALASLLTDADVEYRHAPELGNPSNNREGFRGADIAAARARYAERLDDGAGPALSELTLLARRARLGLLCVERDAEACHRWVICERAQRDDPALVVAHL
jgi:uncharacterized protein (DUF488 family)